MDWVCLLDNEKALRFYDKLGAKRMEDWAVLKVDKASIGRLSQERTDRLASGKDEQGP